MNTVSFTVPADSPAIPKILELLGGEAPAAEAPARPAKKAKAAAAASDGPSFEDCKKLMKEALDVEGVAFEGVRKILTKFKVTKLNDLDPSKFPSFHASLTEALEAAKLAE